MNSLVEKRDLNIKLTNINDKIPIDDHEIKSSFIFHKEEQNVNDSLVEEFLNFKNEKVDKYRFDIKEQYILPKDSRVIKEIMSEGKLIRFYNNDVIEVISKHQNLTRVKDFNFFSKAFFNDNYFYIYIK